MRIELLRTRVKLPYRHGSLSHTVVRAGLEGLNYPEPVWNYPIGLLSSIVVVRAGSEGLNYPELLRNYPTGQVCSVHLWFEQVQEDWTTPNSWKTILQARFPQSYSRWSRFRRIELPRTRVKLPCRHGSLSHTVVRAGLEGLNYPELMSNYPIGLLSSIVQWFEQVQKDWTTPNSWKTILQARFPQSYSRSSRFRRIELPRTRVKLPCRHGSLSHTVVRAGLEGLNYPELMSNYPIGLLSSIVQKVQKDWTTPNSWETTLQPMFTRSKCGLSRFMVSRMVA